MCDYRNRGVHMKFKSILFAIFICSCDDNPKLRELECDADGELKKDEICYSGATNFIISNGEPATALIYEDWNQDGNIDAALVTDDNPTFILELLLGEQSGSFSEENVMALTFVPTQIQGGNFNEDNLPDLLLPNGSQLDVFVRNGQFFSFRTNFELDIAPSFIVAADLNLDGLEEILFSSLGQFSVMRNAGDALFEPPVTIPIIGSADKIFVQNINGDPSPEVFVLNKIGSFGATVDILSNAGGILFPTQTIVLQEVPVDLAFGDIDGDSRVELVSAGQNGTFEIFQNDGAGSFSLARSFELPLDRDSIILPSGIVMRDFDADDSIDIAILQQQTGDLFFVQNGGKAKFKSFVRLASSIGLASFGALVSFDFNRDSIPDLATATEQGLSVIFSTP
jgi:hypothetical protein